MINHCPSCGGFLHYDISSGKLVCAYCGSDFSVESYHSDTAVSGEEVNDGEYEVTMFLCPNCGAKISSTETSAVEYCLYCGSFVTLDHQLKKIRQPDYIVPFSKTKEECKEQYKKLLAKKIYAPKEFRDEEFLESFKGIYIPYWNYDYEAGPNIHIPGKKEWREGDYIKTQHFDIVCNGDLHVDGLNFDASSTFDDEISSHISHIDEEKKKEFHPGYMFGFYGDSADVESNIYIEDANKMAEDKIWNTVEKDTRLKDGYPERPKEGRLLKLINAKRSEKLTMLPVWFLTWRKGDKVAYSVMNGDSGEFYSEIPVDIKRYLLFSLLTAVPIFLILNFMITFNGKSLIILSMFLSCMFILLYSTVLERIAKRVLHVGDKGYLSKHKEEKGTTKKDYSENLLISVFNFIKEFFFVDGISGYILLLFFAFCFWQYIGIALAVILLGAPFYSIYRIYKIAQLVGEKNAILDIASSVFALVLSAVVLFTDPASDIFYYGSAIVCLLAIAISTFCIMNRYNAVITRPVPHFFDRKEGSEQ